MNKKKLLTIIISVLAVGGLATFVALNYNTLTDRMVASFYQPSSEVESLESSLKLTDEGKQIFRATQPAIEDREAFNEHCQSHNVDVAVLGCYTDKHMYLYRVTESDLKGVAESTAAHELLHAVWERMPNAERDNISMALDKYYAEHMQQFSSEMALYDADQRVEELHSRVGVEGKNLPDDLKEHYAQYFQDQAHIVSYYDAYSARFTTLQQEADRLLAEINVLRAKIEESSQEYQARSARLAHDIAAFNSCAETTDCFKNQSEFNTKRAELIAEQEALDALYDQVNQSIETYNAKVAAYNNNIFRTETLQKSLNSNEQLPSAKEEVK